jgi:hypothetical protein
MVGKPSLHGLGAILAAQLRATTRMGSSYSIGGTGLTFHLYETPVWYEPEQYYGSFLVTFTGASSRGLAVAAIKARVNRKW